MATLDDSPSLFVGQPWSTWIANVPSSPESDSCDDSSKNGNDESCGSMKLDSKDMGLFGQCPSQDEFYLVVCDKCDKVVKPKAFKRHLQLRHGGKEEKFSKLSYQSSSSKNHSPTKHGNYRTGHGSVPTKASVKEIPSSISKSQKVASDLHAKGASSEKSNKHNHLAPFVKMERMEMKSLVNQPGTCSPVLTNGDVGVAEVKSDSIDIKGVKVEAACPLPMSPMSPRPPTPVGTLTPFSTSTMTLPVVSSAVITLANNSVTMTTVATVSTPMVSPIVTPTSVTLLTVPSGATVLPAISSGSTRTQREGTIASPSVSISSRSVVSSQSAPNLQSKSSNKKKSIPATSSVSSSSILTSPLRLEKPEKLIPCKDREFDANKHCGVLVEDTGKPCTRSLTCKTHALSLRRKVPGRRKPFDDLLKEHRAAKEALQKYKAEQKANQLAAQGVIGGTSKLGHVPTSASLTSLATSKPNVGISASPAPIISRSLSGSTSPQKPLTKTVRSNSNHVFSRQSSLQSPPYLSKEDLGGSPPYFSERLSDDEEDDGEPEKTDKPYLTHHPKPAAVCTFGIRRHTFGRGNNGCCLFNRQSDIFRAAFMNVLERHLNPPPPKKLCVESKLPQESQLSCNSKDPYEFTLAENSASRLMSNQQSSNSANNSIKGTSVKSKPKPSSNKSKSKESSSSGGSKSPAHVNNSMTTGSAGVKRKRSSSNSGGQQITNPSPHTNALLAGTPLQSASVNCTLSTFTVPNNSGSPLTAIAIPSVNLSSSNLSQLNATLSDGKNPKAQAALLKDFNFVVRNIDPNSFVNGQYVIAPPVLDEKTLLQGNKGAQAPKIVGNLEALQKTHMIPANAILVDTAMQPRTTVLAPVSVGVAKPNTVISIANTSQQAQQPSPSQLQSTVFRAGSVSPQVTSQVPNGLISAQTDRVVGQRPALIHHKPKVNSSQTSQIPQGVLTTSQVVASSNASQVASQVFTHLTQLQVKQGNIGLQKPTAGSKLTMQPVSITLPIPHLSAVSGQQQPTTHALLISNAEDQPRNDLQQMSSSPSSLMS